MSVKTAVIYCRVSTEDQRENGTSLESQAAACQKYAYENGYKVIEIFKESRSGASLDRPMLDKVRDLVRQGTVSAVIFYALDRLSRDETDTLILAREFRSHGVELKCATTPLEDTPQGRFLLTILAAVGKMERAAIMERTTRGKRQVARNGKIMGTPQTLYGYSHEGGHLEITESEAVWVRRVFEWYCIEGVSMLTIVERLYAADVPTRNGGRWRASTVRNMLTQEAYTGEYFWGKTARRGTHTIMHPRSEWIGPIMIPAIISREMYEVAQERVQYNKVSSKRNCKIDYLLRGLVLCPLCGRRYAGKKNVTKKRTSTYYVCSRSNRCVPGERCKGVPVNGHRAEETAWKWVVAHLTDRTLMEGLIHASADTDRAQRERDEVDLRNLLKVRADLDAQENKLVELFTADAISLDKFLELKGARDEQIQGVEKAIREIEERQAARAQAVEDVKSAMQLVEKIQKIQRGLVLPKLAGELSYDDKRAVLEALHVKAIATDTGDVIITGYISEDVLAFLGATECELDIGADAPSENDVLSTGRLSDLFALYRYN